MLVDGSLCPSSRITKWKDTDVSELHVYFAIILATGIVVKSRLEEYWNSTLDIFSTPGFTAAMTYDRFMLLSKCLHFQDNDGCDPELMTRAQAKLFKVQPILDHLNNKFQQLYVLGQNVSVDESLTMWKVTKLQRKWKSLRDSFNRENAKNKNVASGSAATSSKQYIYFNHLSFLNDLKEVRPPTDVTSECATNDAETPRPKINRNINIKRAEKSENEILRTLSENLKRKHDQISDQNDPDKQFLMSLLPHVVALFEPFIYTLKDKVKFILTVAISGEGMRRYLSRTAVLLASGHDTLLVEYTSTPGYFQHSIQSGSESSTADAKRKVYKLRVSVNEYFITKALSLAVETSLVLDSKELAYRKSLADGVQNFISLLNHVAIKNYSGADKDKDFSGSYAADMLQSFFDRSYTCGSDSAKKAEPYIISMLEAIFEIPYIDYIISEAVKKNIINSINTCATKSLAGRSRKRKKKPKKNENTEKIPALTKAAKKYKKGKDQKESNKEIMKKLRTVLNDVIDDKIKNSNKKERNNFVKIFLEIGDNLKSELRRNRLLNETLFQNNIKNDLSVSDAEDRNINVHFDSSVSSIDRNETRENKELRIGFENTPESIESQENIDQNASDEIVFHNNMEIFVRMDKPKANY
ncbi:unnamed protein product [Parnassius mnemosyne]|uniref:PiggyBac transposable element-derived protein domain-containing protein n=1 Tax=Parnassius mnemosyne TaxID=213953 RepID=A0AAV1LB60_9NEOP